MKSILHVLLRALTMILSFTGLALALSSVPTES